MSEKETDTTKENLQDDLNEAIRLCKMLQELKSSADLEAFIDNKEVYNSFIVNNLAVTKILKTKIGELSVELSYIKE